MARTAAATTAYSTTSASIRAAGPTPPQRASRTSRSSVCKPKTPFRAAVPSCPDPTRARPRWRGPTSISATAGPPRSAPPRPPVATGPTSRPTPRTRSPPASTTTAWASGASASTAPPLAAASYATAARATSTAALAPATGPSPSHTRSTKASAPSPPTAKTSSATARPPPRPVPGPKK